MNTNKITCPVCGLSVKLSKTGTLTPHGHQRPNRGSGVSPHATHCIGGNRRPDDLQDMLSTAEGALDFCEKYISLNADSDNRSVQFDVEHCRHCAERRGAEISKLRSLLGVL
jgi:hypothetical protein